MKQIDLPGMKQGILMLASELYIEILTYTNMGRVDDKERTGISLSLSVPDTRNTIVGSVGIPSDNAIYLSVKKAVLSHLWGDSSSLNHEDPSKMRFCGCVTTNFNGYDVQCAVSGLIGFEDMAIAIILQAYANKVTVEEVIHNVKRTGGKFPSELENTNSYIVKILKKYNNIAA